MKKSWLFFLASILAFGGIAQTEAAIIRLDGSGVIMTQGQPIEVIIIDNNGNAYRQFVYYNPAIGGIDLDTSWAGPDASIYFPAWGLGYVWYNGYWVDASGYYWNGSRRIYIDYPNWNNYWTTYWHKHDHRYWHDHWRDRDHHGDWHGREYHGDGHGRDDNDWHRDNWKRRDFDGNQYDGWRRNENVEDRRYGGQWHSDFDQNKQDGKHRGGDVDGGRKAGWQHNDFDGQRGVGNVGGPDKMRFNKGEAPKKDGDRR